jgi:hypothetical protein
MIFKLLDNIFDSYSEGSYSLPVGLLEMETGKLIPIGTNQERSPDVRRLLDQKKKNKKLEWLPRLLIPPPRRVLMLLFRDRIYAQNEIDCELHKKSLCENTIAIKYKLFLYYFSKLRHESCHCLRSKYKTRDHNINNIVEYL